MQGSINKDLTIATTQTSSTSRLLSSKVLPSHLKTTHNSSTLNTLSHDLDANTTNPFPPLSYLSTLPRPRLGKVPYGEVITTCTVPNTLALTFDDGPWEYTPELLDLLSRSSARATFFVCGGNMATDQMTGHGSPHLLRRMLASGHQVGSHTWAHPDLSSIDEDEARRQLWLNERALVGVLGLLPTYLRPPYLSWEGGTLEVAADLGYHVAGVDADTLDWEGDYDAARRNFVGALAAQGEDGGGGRIVLAHDTHEETVHELAGFMIREAKRRGFELVTLGECLGDDKENWYRNPYDGGSWRRRDVDDDHGRGGNSQGGSHT